MVGQEIEERNKIVYKIFRFFFSKFIANNVTSGEKKKKENPMAEFDPESSFQK